MIITDHALIHYRERVARRRLGLAQVTRELTEALQEPLFRTPCREGGEVLALRGPKGHAFCAVVRQGAVITVGPPHYWKETRPQWREIGYNTKKGRWREPGEIIPEKIPDWLREHADRYSAMRLGTTSTAMIVRARLKDGSPVANYDPVALDALLGYAVALEASRGESVKCDNPTVIPLPLRSLGHDPHGWMLWAATTFQPTGQGVTDTIYLHKRVMPGRATAAPKGKALNVETVTGRYMERRMPIPVVRTPEWIAMTHGNVDEVRRLLCFVRSIGKKRALLWGEIAEWDVEPYEADPIDCLHDGARLLRSMPEWFALDQGVEMEEPASPNVGWTPPYWYPGAQSAGWRAGSWIKAAGGADG